MERMHLGHGGDAAVDQPDRLLLQRPHALARWHSLRSSSCERAVDDELADVVGDDHQLVDADAVLVAGVRAEVAARAVRRSRLSAASPPTLRRNASSSAVGSYGSRQ